MKICSLGITCSMLVFFSGASYAAMVGSSRPVAQANFQQLIKTNACPSCDLAGVVLTRIDLSEANLENANLAGAQLFLTDLSNANLRGANLQGAQLGGADLGGADLRGANLTGAVLEGAYLQGAKLDGKIVADTPYTDEDLPEVTEKKYVEQASRGKKAPYTQEAVVTDPRLPAQSVSETGSTKTVTKHSPAVGSTPSAMSKKHLPIANAVVHSKEMGASRQVEAVSEETAREKGFWDSVTSFFDKDSTPVEKKTETITAGSRQAAPVVSAAQPVAHSKKMVPMGDAVVPADVAEQSTHTAVQAAETEEDEQEGGLWSSVTSIFSAGKEKKQEKMEKPAVVQEAPASSAGTGKDALSDNAGVRKMIEQIEGPSPETAETAQEVTSPAQAKVKLDNKEKTSSQNNGEKTVAAAQETAEKPPVASSAPVAAVADKTEAAGGNEADSVVPAGTATVYDVVTPAQAMADRQKIISRLLDEERCVGCDLAGADLSGKDLEKADLERVNLQGANLAGIDLEEANLKGALLSGANLRDADLREADLYMADFSGADLTGAQFEGALIDSADFSDAIGVNLAGANKDE